MADTLTGSNASERIWSHLLVEWTQTDALYQPISSSPRIRYQCIAVGNKHIALGTNTGAIYMFERHSLQYVDVITTDKEGAVVQLAFSPDDDVLAYANSKGFVTILELRFERRQKPEKLRSTGDHKGCTITALKWNAVGNRLYIGDDNGKVSVAKISSSLAKKSDIFKLPSEMIMRLESKVVQIDCLEDQVLVSSLTKTYLCFTSKHQFKHIGTKLRDGKYGAGFFHNPDSDSYVIFCARPGSRLWEVDSEGNVLSTHQFKQLLNTPPLPVVKAWPEKVSFAKDLGKGLGPVSTNFIHLSSAGEYLVTWSDDAFFILDPLKAQVLLWNNQITGIREAVVDKREIFLLFEDRVQKLELLPIGKVVTKLFHMQSYTLCATVAATFSRTLNSMVSRLYVPQTLLAELKERMRDENETLLMEKIEDIVKAIPEDEVSFSSDSKNVSFDKLESGIYMLRQRSVSEVIGDVEENKSGPESTEHHQNGKVDVELNEDVSQAESPTTEETEIGFGQANNEQEDTVSRGSSNLSRHQSSESLVSATSLSSNELMFGPLPLDPEPTYAQKKSRHLMKGRKAKVTSVTLEKGAAVTGPIKRSQSASVLSNRSSSPDRRASTVSADSVLTKLHETDVNKQQSQSPCPTSTQQSTERYSSSTENTKQHEDPNEKLQIQKSAQNSLESSAEVDDKKQILTSKTPDAEKKSPRFGFKSVKDRVSAKMETVGSTVGSRTKSLLQSLKDKTDQLSGKRFDQEPSDVSPAKGSGEFNFDRKISSHPQVDTNKLKEATKHAKEQLDNPDIRLNPVSTNEILSQWILCLHETQHSLHVAVHEQKFREITESKTSQQNDNKDVCERSGVTENREENSDLGKDSFGELVECEETLQTQHFDEDNTNCKKEKNTEDEHAICDSICQDEANENSVTEASRISVVMIPVCVNDPFGIEREEREKLAELAVLCFINRVHGNPSEVLKCSGIGLPHLGQNEEQDNSACDAQKVGDTHTVHGLSEAESGEEEKEDYELGVLLRCYFHLYKDQIENVVKIIQRNDCPNTHTWNALVECLTEVGTGDAIAEHIDEGNIEGAFDVLRSGPSKERRCRWAHLARLFTLHKKRTLEFCCELAKEISPQFVLYLCRGSDSFHELYLLYTKQLLMTHPTHKREEVVSNLCNDEETRLSLLEALLREGLVQGATDSNSGQLFCQCGNPAPGSHRDKWKEREQLDAVLSKTAAQTESTLQLCKKYGYWRGFLKLLGELKHQDDLIATIVQLGDVNLLQAYRPFDSKDWHNFFKLKKQQHKIGGASDNSGAENKIFCVFCHWNLFDLGDLSLTFENLCICSVKDLGPSSALGLLEDLDLPESVLSWEFYQHCILAASLESQQRVLVHNMLEKLDTYLWSTKPNSIPSQVQSLVECEKKPPGESVVENMVSKLSFEEGAIRRSLEEQDTHWGTVVNLEGFCLACFLSLQDRVDSDGGVVVFRCGHAFHKHCFSERTCIVCSSSEPSHR